MDRTSPRLKAALERLNARIDWERQDRGAMRVELGPMIDLAARLGDPHRAFRSVHVGGTKGKGSVASLVRAGLSAAGLHAGRYGSPHVERVNERVELDGGDVPDELLAQGIEAALAAQAQAADEGSAAAAATWFDLMTAAGFWVFREAGVEWAVVEVGLGGRLDSTNVLDPELCLLTNVDLEHTDVLGSTLSAIAGEKAGILKAGVPLVCGVPQGEGLPTEEDAHAVIATRAQGLGVDLHQATPRPTLLDTNRHLAEMALDVLGGRGVCAADGRPLGGALLASERVRSAARLPGRMEVRHERGTPVVLDGAHVPSSLTGLLDGLARDDGLAGPCLVVVSLAQDKDAEAFLGALRGRAEEILCTSVESGRHRPAQELADVANTLGLRASAIPSPREALDQALARADEDGWVLVTGSLYLVGAVRPTFQADSSESGQAAPQS